MSRFLGEGARKRVYLAHDERLDRDVAVALIPAVGSDEAARDRIAREARAMARLGSHPNIVTVHDFGEEGDAAYIVSEYMAQGSVAELLAAAGGSGLAIEHAARLSRQVAAALAHAHRAGIVHRDVKPHNVFVNEDGHARLGDFGVALALDRPRLSGEGMVGTVDYMPPEQALGRPVDARSDLYSLGAMLYELVCGRPPFRGDDIVAIVSQHINSPPVAPSWHRPDVPALLEQLILALLEKAPDDRPDSAEQVGTVLESIELAPARAADEEANPLGRLDQGEFVGRRAELDRLRGLLDGALEGHGALALVSGEPGIGKTRLLEELGAYAGLRGARVGWGRCYEGEGAPPYWPWVQLVRAYLGARPAEAWAAAMGTGVADIARVVPEVAEAAGTLAAGDGDESPEQARFRFFEAMGRFLRNAATDDKPLLLVLDDLHWADAPSLLLLGFLARQARGAPVLIVGMYRETEVDHRAIGELDAEARIALGGLREDDVARFIELRSGAVAHPRLVEAAYTRTDGNPFFLTEVMRLLVSEGGLQDDPERALGVPQGVREVIGRRLVRLSEAARGLLTVAAAIGREFGLDVLQRAADLPADEILDALDEAVESQVVEAGRAGRFRFTHALVRETVYDELGTVRRLRLHLKVGEALEAVHGRAREAHVAELAHHWFEALPVAGADKAVEYSIAAAERSHAGLAYEVAARHYDRACRALELAGQEDDPRRIELLLARGDEQTHAGAVEASHRSFREAAELARAQGLPELQARAALGFAQWSILGPNDPAVALLEQALAALPVDDSALRAEVLVELAIHLPATHRERKDALSAEAVAMARRIGDPSRLALMLANHHATIWGPDNLPERLALAEEQLALALEVGDRSRERWAHFLCFVNRLEGADVAAADLALDAFAATSDDLGQPYYRWYAALMRRTRALMDGRMADAHALADDLDELYNADDGDDTWARTVQEVPLRWQQGRLTEVRRLVEERVHRHASIPAYRCLLAWIDAETGRVDAARRELERFAGNGGLAELPRDEHWLAAVANLAATAAALGDSAHAAALHEHLAPYADRLVLFDAGWACLGPCARHLGALAALAGAHDEAVAHFEHALAVAARAGSRPWVAQVECDLAALLGATARARELAGAARGVADELALGGLAERALAVQRAAGAPAPRAQTTLDAMAQTLESQTPGHLDGTEVPITLLFSDIEGSTELNERLGDQRWLEVLEEHNAIVHRAVRAHGGTEVKSAGDGFMLSFARPADGLGCAIDLQRGLAERTAAGADCPLRVRIGVHTGPAIRRGTDFFGRNVVVAARIAAQARGGEILVSEQLRELAAAPVDREARELALKGLEGTQRVHAITWAADSVVPEGEGGDREVLRPR